MVRGSAIATCVAALLLSIAGGCERKAPSAPEQQRPETQSLLKMGAVPAFKLTAQDGSSFTHTSLEGRVTAANFIFTSCPSVCPLITKRAADVQAKMASSKGKFQIVSFSVDPETDTPDVLTTYGKQYGADFDLWTFVTGDAAVIEKTVVEGFKLALGDRKYPEGEDKPYDILHASHFVLIDAKRNIRGYYRSDDEGVERLVADAKTLVSGASIK